MFGTLGVPEMMVIFVLALLLFGPKKLPELGRTIGKAMTEFRRASNELKQTFDREMRNLEQETDSLKQISAPYQESTYNYDYGYESNYEGSYGNYDSATTPSTTSASATQDAESHSSVITETASSVGGEHGAETAAVHETVARSEHPPASPAHAESSSTTADPKTEHKA
jgi:sec-independent protein translocase protein TatA